MHRKLGSNFTEMAYDFRAIGDEAINTASNFKALSTQMQNFNDRMEAVLKKQNQYDDLMKEAQNEFVRFSQTLVDRLRFVNSLTLLIVVILSVLLSF